MLEGNAGTATVDFLAGETLGGDFNVRRQQHHVGIADGLRTQRIARADRALGLDLQVIAQPLGRLLQGLGGHEGVGHTRRASRDRHQTRCRLAHRQRFSRRRGNVDLGL
ncbi:hypothetical protein D3C85_818580 [compost metagenome]